MDQSTVLKKVDFSKEIMSQLTPLKSKNNWYNWFSIALDWFCIALSIYIYYLFPNVILYLLAIIIIGGRMRGLDNLMHEASHFMLFKNKWLNKWVACFFIGFPVFTSFTSYRLSHYKHHKFLWTEKDPDTMRLKKMGLANQVEQNGIRFFVKFVFIPFFRYLFIENIVNIILNLINPKGQNKTEFIFKLVFWATITITSIIFDFWLQLIMFYIVPLTTVFQIIRLWSDISDHSGLESNQELYASRNSYGSFIERHLFYPHHDSYHIIHHLFPNIPHYNLHKAHLTLLQDNEYRKAHHCVGTISDIIPGIPSVLNDIANKNK